MSIYGTPITASKNTIYVPGTNISIVNNKISAVGVVSTNAQSLSDTQKNQARANIAAVSSGDVSGMIQGIVKVAGWDGSTLWLQG